MLFGPEPALEKRLESLEEHLKEENPVLLEAVGRFRDLDRVAYRLGYLNRSQSFATLVPWWPLISILGTFSAGKSTFINHYLDFPLQSTGNQAVDDKFSVICHSLEESVHVLPGFALDADPRFPFYQISGEIDKVSSGEGQRIDSYLQLKTCPSPRLKGKIIIDSPGFDADEQRTSTLRITEHIVNLSDLVLVFFDARHPEPGAMQDTLKHLVENSIKRSDSSKFLYILNQIDTTAREDNPEEVFGAWQRALAQKGLTAGRFYTTYNPDASVPIDDDNLRKRFETKRDADLEAIHQRIHQVEVERVYRIVGALEKHARDFEDRIVPLLSRALDKWRRNTLIADGVVFGTMALLFLILSFQFDYWNGLMLDVPWLPSPSESPNLFLLVFALILSGLGYLHFMLRKWMRRPLYRWLANQAQDKFDATRLQGAFDKSTSVWRSLFSQTPAGWSRGVRRRLKRILGETDTLVQKLNDCFAKPSGKMEQKQPTTHAAEGGEIAAKPVDKAASPVSTQ